MKIIFGVDIGGTEIKIGKFNGIELIEKYSIKTDVCLNCIKRCHLNSGFDISRQYQI